MRMVGPSQVPSPRAERERLFLIDYVAKAEVSASRTWAGTLTGAQAHARAAVAAGGAERVIIQDDRGNLIWCYPGMTSPRLARSGDL